MNQTLGPVVKVGGSLLELDDLPKRLEHWLSRQRRRASVLVVGGGRWVDAIRDADKRFALGEEASHWLCIRAMGLTARLLAELLPWATLTCDLDDVKSAERRPLILNVEHFLRDFEPSVPGRPLPHNWQVTSDSITARVAIAANSPELVLLKSTLPPGGSSVEVASVARYVDAYLPNLAAEIPRIRCVDFRDPNAPEAVLAPV